MLTKSQVKFLKSLSNTVENKYQVGKNEVTVTLIDMLSKALDKYELIKVCVNQSVKELKNEFAQTLVQVLHAELIQIIGGVIVLYRKNLREPKIKLPK